MTIRKAMRMLALRYQKNIVPTENVTGLVTVAKLYNVTIEESLEAILGTNKYEVQGNFIKVFSADEYQQNRRIEDRVITLYYITAAEAKNLIKPLLSDSGEIGVTSPAMVDTIPGAGGDTLSMRDTIVIYDFPENIKRIEKMIEQVDVRPPQVLIEVTILEATLDETTKFGIDFDFLDTAITAIGSDGLSISGFASGMTPANTGLNVGIVEDHARAFIRALEVITDTTVLANPKILALNKQAGRIQIGEKIGYREASVETAAGGTQEGAVEFLEVGTILEFRPFVCKDGMIRMEIYPKQSSGELDLNLIPNETTTEVKTNIMVEDGKTIVIGGLFKESTELSRSQVPLIGE